jgi:hypothetical protein
MTSEIYLYLWTILCRKIKILIVITSVLGVLFGTGCAFFGAIPFTLSEMKAYLAGKEESLSYPLDPVLQAAVLNLDRMGFNIERVERFNQKGLVYATWQGTSASLSMESITPNLTKVICTFKRPDTMRGYSSEKELYNNIRDTLKLKELPDRKTLFKNMVAVHHSKDNNSPVIAYLGRGSQTEIISRSGEWAEIALMDKCTGYIAFRYLGRGDPLGE